jgi:hypothetical protein
MIDKTQCLAVFLLLYGGAILALFVRAVVRRRLLEYCDSQLQSPGAGASGGLIRRVALAIPRQFSALRGLGQSIGKAPTPVRAQYKRFRILTAAAVTLIACIIIFSLGAHKVCGA